MQPPFLRRHEAARYLKSRFGFGTSRTLAKLACVGGGPPFRKVGSRIVLYEPAALDAWALSRISGPKQHTSEAA